MMTNAATATNSSRKRDRRGPPVFIYPPLRFGLGLGKSSGSSSSDCMVLPHLQLTRVDGISMDGGRRPDFGMADIMTQLTKSATRLMSGHPADEPVPGTPRHPTSPRRATVRRSIRWFFRQSSSNDLHRTRPASRSSPL